jgi:hypothetical protein
MRQVRSVMLFLVGCSFLLSCEKFRSEANNSKSTDSLFLGIFLGMDRKAFYDYCWEQNRKKVFVHGPGNQSVQYKLEDQLTEPVSMQFYPTFHEDKIFEMPVTFNYESWAPWNKKYQADSLLQEMVPLFKRWYGEDFRKLDHPTMGPVFYKIDGKRRINLFRKDDQYVQAVFTDLKVEKTLKEAYAKKLKSDPGKLQ